MRIANDRLSILFGILVALMSSFAASSATGAVSIVSTSSRPGVQACVQELLNSASVVGGAKLISREEMSEVYKADWRSPLRQQTYIEVSEMEGIESIYAYFFVFRDAPHFLAFLQSDLSKQIISHRDGTEFLGMAYGGFTQLFSKAAAVTEPKHLYGRTVSGDARALVIYHSFGANPGMDILAGFAVPDLADRFRRMGADHPMANIVEAPLIGAIENGADRHARYVSLMSASLTTIRFKREGSDKLDDSFLRKWVEAAAMNCSRKNYQTELDTLERLKNAGLTIVPADRRALVERAWRLNLEQEHPYWTIDEFDRLEMLDGGPKGVPLPSAIVAKLPPAKRKKALQFDEAAKKEIGCPHEC